MLAYFRDQLEPPFAIGLKQVRATSLTARLACLLFLGFSLPMTYYFTYFSGYDGTGWLRTTTPIFVPGHWLLGFGAVYQENLVIHHENMPAISDVSMLSGGRFAPDTLFSIRALYPFFGTFLAPLLGAVKALLLINYCYWALAAYVAWRFTKKLFNDERAALLAVLFVTGGIGWLTNLGDLSPHLASYSVYFFVTLLLYESRVWTEQRPLRTHLLLGVVLALALLNYQNGFVLIIFYALVALRRNRLPHVLAGVLIGLSAPYLWALQLNLQGIYFNERNDWVDYLHHTGHTLQGGLAFLQENWRTPLVIVGRYSHDFVQLMLALESLPVVLLGLLSWWTLRRDLAFCWFWAMGFLLQVGAVVPLAVWPQDRGAYVYGAALFVIIPASYTLAQLSRARGVRRGFGLMLAALVLSYHFYWGAAQFWGNTAPLSVYQSTVLANVVRAPQHSFISTEQPVVLSLTGAEPTPQLYWGNAGVVEAGALAVEPPARWSVKWNERQLSRRQLIFQSIAIRIPFLIYFTALLLLLNTAAATALLPRYRKAVLLPVWLVFWLGAAFLAALFNKIPAGESNTVTVPPGATLRYSVQVSDAFLQQLEKQLARDAFLEGFTIGEPGAGQYQLRLSSGGAPVFEQKSDKHLEHFSIPTVDETGRSFIDKLKQHKEITLEYVNHGAKDLTLYAWQRAGLPGRKLTATPPLDERSARVLPSFELRVRPRQPENRTVYLIGF